MKTLLAGLLLAVVVNVAAADPLKLTLEIYRIPGDAGLLKDQSPTAQLEMLADKKPEITQSIAIQPDGTARSSTRIGAFTLEIDAKVNPTKEGAYRINFDFALVEQIQIGSETTPTTTASESRVSVRLGQRQVVSSFYGSINDEPGNWQVLILSLTNQVE